MEPTNIKKLLLFRVPMSVCNFRCRYCYLSQRDESFQGERPTMRYTPEQIAYALRQDRIGGACFINICADGETLLVQDLDKIVHALLAEGHYVEIVTNLSLTRYLEPFLQFEPQLLRHLEFKCSFHYLELKKRGLLDTFADNVRLVWNSGASANIEITPHDELIPYMDEIRTFSMEHFGALPHITIARDDRTKEIKRLTALSVEQFTQTWSVFDSAFFDYKCRIFGVRQNGFCYAGKWSMYVDLTTGDAVPCYCGGSAANVFARPDDPFPETPVGKCRLPHCYNGHALLTLGLIPDADAPGYGDLRDRERQDGSHWLSDEMRAFMNTKLADANERLPRTREQLLEAGQTVRSIGSFAVRKYYAIKYKKTLDKPNEP